MPPFQYRTYQNPYVGTVLDLMGAAASERARAEEAIGNIRAQEAVSKGQSMSQMVGGLANVASQAYGDYTTAQEDKIAQELLQQISDAPEMGVGPGYVSQGVPAGLDPPPLLEPRAGQDRYGGNFMDFTAAPATPSRRRAADILPPAFTADRPQAGARPAFTPPVPARLTAPPQAPDQQSNIDWDLPLREHMIPSLYQDPDSGTMELRTSRKGLPPLNLGASDRALAPPTPYEGTLSAIAPGAPQGGRFGPLIEQYAEENNLSQELVRNVIKRESDEDPNAVGKAGEVGLMQLKEETARDLGVTDRRDPGQNIAGGTQYLRQMLDKFGDEDLALAAYNWGPGNVEEHLAAGKALADMPAGVRDYVAKTRVGSAAATGLAQPQPVDVAQAETPRSLAERAPGLGATGPGLVPGPGLSQGVTPSEVSGPVVPPTGAPAGAPVGAPVGAPAGLRPSGQAPNVLGAMLSGQPVSGDLDDLSRQGRNLGVMARSKARRRYVHKTNDGRVDLGSMDQALAQRGVSTKGRRRILGEFETRNASISAFNQENRALALSEQRLGQDAAMARMWAQSQAQGQPYPDHAAYIGTFGAEVGTKLYGEMIEGVKAFEELRTLQLDNVDTQLYSILLALQQVPPEDQQAVLDQLGNEILPQNRIPSLGPKQWTIGGIQNYLQGRGKGLEWGTPVDDALVDGKLDPSLMRGPDGKYSIENNDGSRSVIPVSRVLPITDTEVTEFNNLDRWRFNALRSVDTALENSKQRTLSQAMLDNLINESGLPFSDVEPGTVLTDQWAADQKREIEDSYQVQRNRIEDSIPRTRADVGARPGSQQIRVEIRRGTGRNPWIATWTNPQTGQRETADFTTQQRAKEFASSMVAQ